MKRILYAIVLICCACTAQAQERGWTVNHAPAAAAQATITKAASTTGVMFVADCVTATFVAGAAAPSAVQVTVVLRDGASGVGTVKWAAVMSLPATAGASAAPVQVCGLGIRGTANTAMTLEFTAGGGSNTVEAVSLRGHDER
jgi:hypothetical protein